MCNGRQVSPGHGILNIPPVIFNFSLKGLSTVSISISRDKSTLGTPREPAPIILAL